MRRGAAGLQLYDSLRLDCAAAPVHTMPLREPVTYFSDAAISADSKRLAVCGSFGGTYIYNVRLCLLRTACWASWHKLAWSTT